MRCSLLNRAGVFVIALLVIVPGLAGCSQDAPPSAAGLTPRSASTLTLTSDVFVDAGVIPREYTCEGANRSPALRWTDPPAGTQSLALLVDDPDAPGGTFIHWIVVGIPAASRALPPSVQPEAQLADGSRQGKNGFGKVGYGGPCPPSGTHHYHFRLYALDIAPGTEAGSSADALRAAMSGHVLATGELVGLYSH